MSTKLLIMILALSTGGNPTLTKLTPPALLPDGTILEYIDGTLTGPDRNDAWFFEPDSDITDNQAVIKAGIKLKLLPSATLETLKPGKTSSVTAAPPTMLRRSRTRTLRPALAR